MGAPRGEGRRLRPGSPRQKLAIVEALKAADACYPGLAIFSMTHWWRTGPTGLSLQAWWAAWWAKSPKVC